MSNNLKKMAKKQQVQQLANLLGSLAPSLQEVQGKLSRVQELGPNLQQVHAEWADELTAIWDALRDTQRRVDQNKKLMLELLVELLDRPDLSMEALLERSQKLESASKGDE